MGEAAKRWILTRTPGERIGLGFELSEAMMRSVLGDLPLESDDPEVVRRAFRRLREVGEG